MLLSSRRLGCSSHTTLGQAAGRPATPSQLDSRDRWGRNLSPSVCKETASWEIRQEPTPQLITALSRYSNGPGVQRKTPWSIPLCIPLCTPLMTRHGNPFSHHSMETTSWTRARENNNVTFIKNTVPLFPLDPTSYLLTGVKYYYSATPRRQVFLSA